jgi:hypothetical protein
MDGSKRKKQKERERERERESEMGFPCSKLEGAPPPEPSSFSLN